ncbi:MAG: hypothetical protein VB012_02930 [Erysipelotrichaceae bacterium]|nr:hypothetical protein [Erysipelotrichaceae bacterium]
MPSLTLKPTEMTKQVMEDLERRNLIIRLAPHRHDLKPKTGDTSDEAIYIGKPSTGPHKLITVTVNRENFAKFGYHQDNEEFLLVGDPNTKPMYLAISYLPQTELEQKLKNQTISSADFILLKCRFNDPEVSFFVMKEGVCHGEAIGSSLLPCPSFYVTEGRDMQTFLPDWHGYQLAVGS